jgi:hypothetical protein
MRLSLEECEYGMCKEFLNSRYVRFRGAGHTVWGTNITLGYKMFDEFVQWEV